MSRMRNARGSRKRRGEVGRFLLGKEHHIRLALTYLLTRGHSLIEDLPDKGKMTLAQALASVLGLSYCQRHSHDWGSRGRPVKVRSTLPRALQKFAPISRRRSQL